MKEILFNLALFDTTRFCKENNIDCSGTYLVKYPRKWTYALCKQDTGEAIVTVTFHKNSVPTHAVTHYLVTKEDKKQAQEDGECVLCGEEVRENGLCKECLRDNVGSF